MQNHLKNNPRNARIHFHLHSTLQILMVGFFFAACANPAQAGERRFTYVYETTTLPPGMVEFEQWITWKTDKDTDSKFDRIDFRHEIEWGVTENFQVAIYGDWRYQDGRSVSNDRSEWRDVAVELIYSLADPIKDPLGVALYGEIKIGEEVIELEAKLLLQKNIGKWVFAWNGIFEAEWEGEEYDEDKGEFGQAIGASYQFSPRFLMGVELLHEVEYDDWSQWQDHVVYLGPNVSYRTENWWMTITSLFQITDVQSEANYQTRFIFGFDF